MCIRDRCSTLYQTGTLETESNLVCDSAVTDIMPSCKQKPLYCISGSEEEATMDSEELRKIPLLIVNVVYTILITYSNFF